MVSPKSLPMCPDQSSDYEKSTIWVDETLTLFRFLPLTKREKIRPIETGSAGYQKFVSDK